jgi:hypothetical protein
MGCRDAARWQYRLDEHFTWRSPFPLERDWAFQDCDGHTRLLLTTEGDITVMKRYAWDGCTPKLCVLDLVVGTPDGAVHPETGKPKTYQASLIHDALYQFLPDDLPLNRRQADQCFLRLMEEHRFALRYVYYLAVRALGWLFRPVTRRIRRTYRGRRIDCSGDAPEPTSRG